MKKYIILITILTIGLLQTAVFANELPMNAIGILNPNTFAKQYKYNEYKNDTSAMIRVSKACQDIASLSGDNKLLDNELEYSTLVMAKDNDGLTNKEATQLYCMWKLKWAANPTPYNMVAFNNAKEFLANNSTVDLEKADEIYAKNIASIEYKLTVKGVDEADANALKTSLIKYLQKPDDQELKKAFVDARSTICSKDKRAEVGTFLRKIDGNLYNLV